MQIERSPTDDDVFDLGRLRRILFRRSKWFAAGLLLCLGVAVAYLALKTPVYEASVKLRIGQVAGTGLLEPADVLASKLITRYGEYIAEGIKRQRPFLKRASASRGTTGVVDLVVEADSPTDAVSLLDRVATGVLKAHDEIFSRNVEPLNSRLQGIDAQRSGLQRQYEEAASLIRRLEKSDPVQASLVAIDQNQIRVLMVRLDAERPNVAQKLAPPQTQGTQMIGEVVAPTEPSTPRLPVVLGLGVVLGIAIGLALALMPAGGRNELVPGGSREPLN